MPNLFASPAARRLSRLILGGLGGCVWLFFLIDAPGGLFGFAPVQAETAPAWARVLVVEEPPGLPEAARWAETSLKGLPGPVVPLGAVAPVRHLLAADLAEPVREDPAWQRRIRFLMAPLRGAGHPLLVYRVTGGLTAEGKVSVRCIPVVRLSGDSLRIRPGGGAMAAATGPPGR